MKMFVANASQQYHNFMYRTSKSAQARQVMILPMAQQQLPDDLDQAQIDEIIRVMDVYGFISVEDFRAGKARRPFTRLCYSIDKPIASIIIDGLALNNRAAQVDEGDKIQKEAAIVSSKAIERSIEEMNREKPDSIQAAEMPDLTVTLQEEFADNDPRPRQDIVAKGFKVEKPRHGQPGPSVPTTKRRGKVS